MMMNVRYFCLESLMLAMFARASTATTSFRLDLSIIHNLYVQDMFTRKTHVVCLIVLSTFPYISSYLESLKESIGGVYGKKTRKKVNVRWRSLGRQPSSSGSRFRFIILYISHKTNISCRRTHTLCCFVRDKRVARAEREKLSERRVKNKKSKT